MKRIFMVLLLAGVLVVAWYQWQPVPEQAVVDTIPPATEGEPARQDAEPQTAVPERAVLDISVHTIEELRVLLNRAEEVAMKPRPREEHASVVLVLHGPEVEFFAIRNYDKYKDVVDQAARLDAFDIVDVKICQSMLDASDIGRDQIPSFIEQVPFGPAEVERLVREGYVYF